MKRVLFIFLSVVVFYGCCDNSCPDLISDQYATIPYNYNQLIHFQNEETGEINIDTVIINSEIPRGGYGCFMEKEGSTVCYGFIEMKIGDFKYIVSQGWSDDVSYKDYGFSTIYSFNCFHNYNVDTVNIDYCNENIVAIHFVADTSKLKYYYCSKNQYCKEFYISLKNKLLKYTLYSENQINTWILVNE